MIKGYRGKIAKSISEGKTPKAFPANLTRNAARKLAMLHAAVELSDLASPPGNRLESLSGSRKGQHSVRINNKWRVCFVWRDSGPSDVEIVDYHKG